MGDRKGGDVGGFGISKWWVEFPTLFREGSVEFGRTTGGQGEGRIVFILEIDARCVNSNGVDLGILFDV